MKKFAIFDLDGTLFDTTQSMQLCGNFALASLGLPTFPRERYAVFSGGGIEGFVFGILEAAGDLEHRHFDQFWRLYLEKQSTLALTDVNFPFSGIKSLLFQLKQKGVGLGVLSNKDHGSCVEFVEAFFGKDLFDIIRGDQMKIPVKPDPAGVFAILEEVGVKKEDCIYIGDTEVDMLTGKNAKVFTVAALWGYRTKEQLASFEPDFLASSPMEILSLF